MTEAQTKLIELQQQIINLQAKLGETATEINTVLGTEVSPNADEAIIAYTDAGQKALDGASNLVDQVLTGVKELLHSIG